MDVDYRRELFDAYGRRSAALDPDQRSKISWFAEYARVAYLPHMGHAPQDAMVVDVGCNKGFLLAALHGIGFRHVAGFDLSESEIVDARRLLPDVPLEVADAVDFFDRHPGEFDVVIVKAVLEHVPKSDTLTFLRALRRGLRQGGRVIIDVPNMDWLFATHERYMDFTHETGFTRESLTQVLLQVFPDVDVRPVDWLPASWLASLRMKLARRVLGALLSWSHPEGGENPLWARSIVGVAR